MQLHAAASNALTAPATSMVTSNAAASAVTKSVDGSPRDTICRISATFKSCGSDWIGPNRFLGGVARSYPVPVPNPAPRP